MRKRIISVFAVIVFSAMILFIGYIEDRKLPAESGSIIIDVPEDYVTGINTWKLVRYEEYINNITTIEKNAIKQDIDDMLGDLPKGVLDMLEPYTIVVTNKNLNQFWFCFSPVQNIKETLSSEWKGAGAFIIYPLKIIFLDADDASYRDTIYHEIGHLVDYSYNRVSEGEEFLELYEKEYKAFDETFSNFSFIVKVGDKCYKVIEHWDFGTPREFFAEAFNRYCLNRGRLWETCPETYKFIDKIIKELQD